MVNSTASQFSKASFRLVFVVLEYFVGIISEEIGLWIPFDLINELTISPINFFVMLIFTVESDEELLHRIDLLGELPPQKPVHLLGDCVASKLYSANGLLEEVSNHISLGGQVWVSA